MTNDKARNLVTAITNTPEFQGAFTHGLWIVTGVVAGLCIFMAMQPKVTVPPYIYTYKLVSEKPDVAVTPPTPSSAQPPASTPAPATSTPPTEVTPITKETHKGDDHAAPTSSEPAPVAKEHAAAAAAPAPETRTEPPPAPKITLPIDGVYTIDPTFGKLPTPNKDGTRPFDSYRRAINPADLEKPLIALVMTDVGLSTQNSTKTLDALSAPISVTISQYADDINKWAQRAYDSGHELWLDLSVQPEDYPDSDPGTDAILLQNSILKNKQSLLRQLGTVVGYAGIFEKSPSPVFEPDGKADLLTSDLFARGLGLVLNETSPEHAIQVDASKAKAPYYAGEMIAINNAADAPSAFTQAETTARTRGYAIVIFRPAPYAVAQIAPWIKTLHDKGIALAPLSVIAERGADLMKQK